MNRINSNYQSDNAVATSMGATTSRQFIKEMVKDLLPQLLTMPKVLHQLEEYTFSCFDNSPPSCQQKHQWKTQILQSLRTQIPPAEHPAICMLLDILDGIGITIDHYALPSPEALQNWLSAKQNTLYHRTFGKIDHPK